MDRYTRRQYFERLVAMREAHGHLGIDDTTSCLSIEDAIAYANDLLESPAEPAMDTDGAHPKTA